MQAQIAGGEKEQTEIASQIVNLTDQIGRTDNAEIRDIYQGRIVEFNRRNAEVAEYRRNAEILLRTERESAEAFVQWQATIKKLKSLILAEDAVDLRLSLRNLLASFIDRIEVFADGFPTQTNLAEVKIVRRPKTVGKTDSERAEAWRMIPLGTTDEFESWIGALADEFGLGEQDPKLFSDFVSFVSERRKTKLGRFLRVQFKNGAVVDLAPPDSIAFHWRLRDRKTKRWSHETPDLEGLWIHFKAQSSASGVNCA